MSRFIRGRSAAYSFFILAIGLFIGWQSALYSVQDGLSEPQAQSEVSPTEEAKNPETLDFDFLMNVYEQVKADYVDVSALDAETQLYGAVKGLVKSIGDPYTTFMDPEETEQFQTSLEGTLEGIGAELTMEDNLLTVIAPLKSSPAETAGLQAGDVIYKIDDLFVSDLTLFEAIMHIRGEAGTTVTLTLVREGQDDFMELVIQRAQIDVPSVEFQYKGPNENLAYISVYQFADKTEAEFDRAVQDVLLHEVDGVILDLRYNGGGFLDVSVDMLSDFLEGKQKALVTKHRDESQNEIFYTNESARLAHLSLVVLVNEGSASASEIVAGAIQDHKKGVILGTQTFGKGSVQVVNVLDNGSSLRTTVAKWYTPSDRSINDVGITPDMVVEQIDDEAAVDEQLEAAIRYLEELE